MKISIQNGTDGQKRVIASDTGMLVGLMTKRESSEIWRVEMFSRYDVEQSNYDRAVGFVYGVAAATAEVD